MKTRAGTRDTQKAQSTIIAVILLLALTMLLVTQVGSVVLSKASADTTNTVGEVNFKHVSSNKMVATLMNAKNLDKVYLKANNSKLKTPGGNIVKWTDPENNLRDSKEVDISKLNQGETVFVIGVQEDDNVVVQIYKIPF